MNLVQTSGSNCLSNAPADKIIAKLSLKSVPPDKAESLLDPRDDLPWWKPDSIDNRDLWIKEKENEYYRQLWYSL